LSTSKELEELQNRKAGLEAESLSLTDKQKNLDERVKVLEEKIAIEELKNNNKATQEAISQLESKINGLERRLKEVSLEPNAPKAESAGFKIAETQQTVEEGVPKATETIAEDSGEEVITVAAPEETMTFAQETFDDNKKTHEKKKRKLF
jgi:hypothetical protein